jgi:5-methylcytosine-specific restriction endonuclease McrA
MTYSHGVWHIAEYSLRDAIRNQHPHHLYVNGKLYEIRSRVKRNKVIRAYGGKCACCGLHVTQAFVDVASLASYRATLGVYGTRKGKLIRMTLDHIVPTSRGGSNSRSNLQLLCEPCNSIKADKELTIMDLKKYAFAG